VTDAGCRWLILRDRSQSQRGSPPFRAMESLVGRIGGGDENQGILGTATGRVCQDRASIYGCSADEVHANHNEAQNAALRRQASANAR